MIQFFIGLAAFLGIHSMQIVAADRRAALVERHGEKAYKAIYSLVSIIALALIWMGYAAWRAEGIPQVWTPPIWTRHLAYVLMIPAFIALVAAYFPGRIKSALKHPMLVAIKIWALAHLLANGDLASLILFGGILAWAVADRISVKRRVGGSTPPQVPVGGMGDVIAVVGGLAVYGAFVLWLHAPLIGVAIWPVA